MVSSSIASPHEASSDGPFGETDAPVADSAGEDVAASAIIFCDCDEDGV